MSFGLNVSRIQSKIIFSLGHYCFITDNQLLRIRVTTQKDRLYEELKILLKRSLISKVKVKHSYKAQSVAVPNLYFLTKKGIDFYQLLYPYDSKNLKYWYLIKDLSDLNCIYRKQLIDCQITIEMACKKNGGQILNISRGIDNQFKNINNNVKDTIAPTGLHTGDYY